MRIAFNPAGFNELLTSAGAETLVDGHAQRMAAAANAVPSTTEPAATEPYYEVVEASDGKRARRRIRTTGPRASKHEAKTQALLRSLGA